MRPEVLKRIGGFEEDFRGIYQHCEDQAFLAKISLNVPIFVASQCWDKYRQHPNSCSSVVERTASENCVWLFYLNWLEEYLSKQEVKDPKIWKLLQRELWPYHHPRLFRLLKLPRSLVKYIKGQVKRTAERSLLAKL